MVQFEFQDKRLGNWVNLQRTSELISRLSDRIFAGTAINQEEFRILTVVKAHPQPVSLRDAAKWLSRASNTISPIVYRLEQKGLLARSGEPSDRRLILLSLTSDGEQTLAERNEAAWVLISKAMEPLSEDELTELSSVLSKLESHLNNLLDVEKIPEKVVVKS